MLSVVLPMLVDNYQGISRDRRSNGFDNYVSGFVCFSCRKIVGKDLPKFSLNSYKRKHIQMKCWPRKAEPKPYFLYLTYCHGK